MWITADSKQIKQLAKSNPGIVFSASSDEEEGLYFDGQDYWFCTQKNINQREQLNGYEDYRTVWKIASWSPVKLTITKDPNRLP